MIGDHAGEAFRDTAQLDGGGPGIAAHEVPFDGFTAQKQRREDPRPPTSTALAISVSLGPRVPRRHDRDSGLVGTVIWPPTIFDL